MPSLAVGMILVRMAHMPTATVDMAPDIRFLTANSRLVHAVFRSGAVGNFHRRPRVVQWVVSHRLDTGHWLTPQSP